MASKESIRHLQIRATNSRNRFSRKRFFFWLRNRRILWLKCHVQSCHHGTYKVTILNQCRKTYKIKITFLISTTYMVITITLHTVSCCWKFAGKGNFHWRSEPLIQLKLCRRKMKLLLPIVANTEVQIQHLEVSDLLHLSYSLNCQEKLSNGVRHQYDYMKFLR